ncbi:MAG: DUF87 domain-containing protein [Candidatus Vogelbacteria bacterium]
MEKFTLNEHPKFNSPAEELDFLRQEVARRELEAEQKGESIERPKLIKRGIEEYRNLPAEKVLTENLKLPAEQTEALVLKLTPEDHDETMAELLVLLRQKGIKNTLAIVAKLNNSHIEDDFHRFLVEYLQEGHAISHLKERSPLFRALNMALYEIILPTPTPTEQPKSLKEIVSSMEQFFAGMLSIPGKNNRGQNYFTLELAIPNYGEEYSFYASIPIDKRELFEKQILAIFHNAKVSEKRDDYNIFNEQGGHAASYAVSGKNPIFPLKTYKNFDHDPLNVVLNSFSKIDRAGEGAALQIIFNPTDDLIAKKYESALKAIQKGTPIKDAINIAYTTGEEVWGSLKEVFFARDKKKSDSPLPPPDPAVVERIKDKISSPIMKVNIRVASSSRTVGEAESILADIESAFNQFENTLGNRLKFERVKPAQLGQFLHNFSYRLFSSEQSIPLNIEEVSTLMHFQTTGLKGADQLKQTRAISSPAPSDLPESGLLLGVNRSRGAEKNIFMTEEDRLRHFYVIGQTGTGKTTLLKNMIVQDIARGNGVCLIDPHGLDIMDVLSLVPPERYDDVIYFDPSYTARPMALNMLEYDERYPEQKTFVVNELFNIFQKLYGAVPESMGPMFEQYFRNATMLVIEDPSSGSTLLDVSRVLSDKAYRQLKLSRCRNPVIVQFWREVAEKAGGEGALANIVPYITSKFDVFLANDFMRPIVAQEKSVFNFRQIMDQKKILLVNLAKGRLGDINANLIGLILVGKILMATLSRVDSLGQDLPSFYFYIDEFQNVTTDSISTILSEARKYKLSLNVAHQFIAQLDEKIRDSVFGNVGSIAAFRVGSDDAEYLEKQFAPTFTAQDLMNIDNRQAYVKLLVNGRPVKPFDLSVLPPERGSMAKVEELKQLSYTKYGKDRAEVEALILEKYKK